MEDCDHSEDQILHVFWHDDCLKHDNGAGFFDMPQGTLTDNYLEVKEAHPEGADRLRNMRSILKRGPISKHVVWHDGRTATPDQLLLFHTPAYIQQLEAAGKAVHSSANVRQREAAAAFRQIEAAEKAADSSVEKLELEAAEKAADAHGESIVLAGGTVINAGSYDAILAAAGTTLAAMDWIAEGRGKIAYALVRPPGHHAQTDRADGYCFVNNAGLAAAHARQRGFQRIAVIDVDVHHGNGTQEGFYTARDVLTVSIHMDHGSWDEVTHPQQGAVTERGEGFSLNIPLPFGTGNKGYDYAMQQLVEPCVNKFNPDLIIVPLGLDGSAFDPNGRQALTMTGFRQLGQRIRALAAANSGGRVLVVQEGGYCVSYAAYCLHAFLCGLQGLDPDLDDPIGHYPENEVIARTTILELKSRVESL